MQKNVWTFLFVFLLSTVFLAPGIFAAALEINYPPQNLITFNPMVMLKGQVSGYSQIKVNGNPVDINSDGKFSVAAYLNPGKNFIEVVAIPVKGKPKIIARKILRLATFVDIAKITEKSPKVYLTKPVNYLWTLEIVEPYPDNNFYPANGLTKGELATWICRAKKLKVTTPVDDPAYDVPAIHWRAPFIAACLQNGYMQKNSDEIFGIDDNISRAEVVQIVTRAENITDGNQIKKVFKDVPLVHDAAKEVYLAWSKDLVVGVSSYFKLFDPNRFITRGEAATLFARLPSVHRQIETLLDFSSGYDQKVFAQINTAPKVIWLKVNPPRVSKVQNRSVNLSAKIADRQGYVDIANVKIDLSSLGGPPDALMLDEGKEGDEKSGDAIFSLQLQISQEATGGYPLKVTATDKKGWEGTAYNSLTIVQ